MRRRAKKDFGVPIGLAVEFLPQGCTRLNPKPNTLNPIP